MKKNLIFYTLLLLYVIYIIDIISVIGLFNGIKLTPKYHLKNILIPISVAFVFLSFLASIIKEKYFKLLLILITIPFTFINSILIWYALYYNALIDIEIMHTILNTNTAETKEFISHTFNYVVFVTILILSIPFVLIYFMKPYKIKSKILLSLMLIASTVVFVLIFDKRWIKREIAITKLYDVYKVTNEDRIKFMNILAESDNISIQYNNIQSSLSKNQKQTFVLIINESQNRHHFSLYGYDKKTTPFLDSISNEIYAFKDVVSPSIFTNTSVEKIITFSDNHNNLKGYESGNIIKFFQNAGFHTYWISNQYFLGDHESAYSAIAYRSDTKHFLNKVSGKFLETKHFDDSLIPIFKKSLEDNYDKKLIILHFMGSHAPYEARYPANFGSFKYNIGLKDLTGSISKSKTIATYDNSIEFTDSILKEIILSLKKENNESYLLFLSDHGVDVYDTDPNKEFSRNMSYITPSMYEIPFFIWFSDNYKKAYPDIIENTKKAINKSYQIDRVDHTIIDLSRLNHEIFIPEDSIISPLYKEKKRIIGDILIDKK